MLISQFAPTSVKISEHSDQYCGFYISPIVNFCDNSPIATMIEGLLIFTMDGMGQNLQLQSDGSEILCAIKAPHKTYAYQILCQNMSYFASYGKKCVCRTLKIWVYYNIISKTLDIIITL